MSPITIFERSSGRPELYGVPADGSAPAVKVSAPLQGTADSIAGGYELWDAGGRVLYLHALARGGPELFSAPWDGGQPAVRLHGELVEDGQVLGIDQVLSDGTVLFRADLETWTLFDLYRVPADGSASPLALNHELVSGGWVTEARATEDESRVVYLAGSRFPGSSLVGELYVVPIPGGAPLRLSGELPRGDVFGAVFGYQVSSDGERAVYLAQEEPSGAADLHGVATDGSGRSIRLNRSFGQGSTITQFALTPDGARVVYLVGVAHASELFSAPIDAREASVRLDGDPVPNDGAFEGVLQFVITPDSQTLLYEHGGYPAPFSLRSVPVDGSAPPAVLLTFTYPYRMQTLLLSPDGSWVVYTVDPTQVQSWPLDGHQAPVPLVPTSGTVDLVTTSPDSERVLYRLASPGAGLGLYSAPIDGSAAPARLDAPLAPGGNVSSYLTSPDGSRVVFLADREVDERFDLFSAPVDGSQAPVKLDGTLVASGDVRLDLFQIDPTSGAVVYAADEETDEVVELYSVPIDGSGPRVKVSGIPAPGTDVQRMSLSGSPFRTGAGRVVYLAGTDPVSFDLSSAPLDGSSPAVRLNAPRPAGGVLSSFVELTLDGAGVLYAGEQRFDEVTELFRVPIDGSGSPRLVSGPLVAGGDVQVTLAAFQVSPDGQRVLYRADQETDGVVELFAAVFQRPPRRSAAPSRTIVR
jgi:Tol biopolymer transport system component